MIKYHEVEQGSDEWHEEKRGLLSASNATPIRVSGSGLLTYCRCLSRQRLGHEIDGFNGYEMQRGTRLEPLAVLAYEFEFNVKVRQVGGVTNSKYKNVWISPDGLIEENGGAEIKARNDEKHYALITGCEKDVPIDQIQMSLLITERKWWDFVSFNPNFDKTLFVKRIYPDAEMHVKFKDGFVKGNELIEKYKNDYLAYKLK